MIPLEWYIGLSSIIFIIGAIGFMMRRNLIIMLVCVELVAFSHYLQDLRGQIFVFFIITVAAAEAAIGLAILVVLVRNKGAVHTDEITDMKG